VSTSLLELHAVSRRFGGLAAVADLSMEVKAGTVHGLIGPNGAGKSTVFNLISGVLPLSSGVIRFKGQRISGLRPADICRRGIARTFQATTVFSEYTVLENLVVAGQRRADDGTLAALVRSARYRRGEVMAYERARELLAPFRLEAVADRVAGSLPHRDQKALGVGMALATGAEIVLLDEPLAGLAMQETRDVMDLLRTLRRRGLTILLVEHDMRAVMGLCDRITVLDHGTRIAQGTPSEVQSNPAVVEAYLGAAMQSEAGG
jgi:branched-chain amino acid transport system ATP-binding protein